MTEHKNALKRRTILSAFLAVVLTVGLMVPFTSAQATPSAADKQAEADAALEKLNSLQEELDIASNNYYNAVAEQEAAEQKVEEAQAQIEETTAKIAELQEQLGNRAHDMYRSGGTSFLDVFLGSSSFEEFANNMSMFNKIAENDAELVQETKDARTELENAKTEAETQAQVAADKAAEAEQVMNSAQAAQSEAQAVYDNLSAEARELMEAEEAAQSAADAAAAQQAASNPSSSSGGNYNNDKVQTVTGNIVVDRAYAQLGKPYGWGDCGPGSFDCSGLVSYCLSGSYGTRLGTTGTFINWPRISPSQAQPGDIVVNSHHCGVYIGGGQMIHAPRPGKVVQISGVHSDMVYVRY